MKEYNIMEAVEYLKNNPDAKFHDLNSPKRILYFSFGKIFIMVIDKSLPDIMMDLRYYDFNAKWILQTPHRTHAEIINNWFRYEGAGRWQKVIGYNPVKETYFFDNHSAGGYFRKHFDNCEMKTDKEMQEMED